MDEVEVAKHNIQVHVKEKLGFGLLSNTVVDSKYDAGCWKVQIRPAYVSEDRSDSAGFLIYSFPGCCKYAILSQVYTKGAFRGIGLVKYMLELAEIIAVLNHEVDTLVATGTDEHNGLMISILEKSGWKKIHEGDNINSGNWVRMFVKELPSPEDYEEL